MLEPISLPSAALETLTVGLRPIPLPGQGWLRTVRETLGRSRQEVADELQVSQAAVRDFELAEVTDAITLRTFRRTARALGCELVIALVPADNRSFSDLAGARERKEVRHRRTAAWSAPDAAEEGDIETHLK